jgi:hypothetical protein
MVAIRYGWFVAVCKLLNFEGPTLCSTAVLTANKYTPNVNHVKVVGENATTTPLQTPAYDSLNTNRSAIALDCENVGVGEILEIHAQPDPALNLVSDVSIGSHAFWWFVPPLLNSPHQTLVCCN